MENPYFNVNDDEPRKKTWIIVLAVIVGVVLIVGSIISVSVMFSPLSDGETRFQDWMQKHSRKYLSEEEYQKRMEIFMANLQFIAEHNDQDNTFTVDVNQFADWTNEEFAAQNRLKTRERNQTNEYEPRVKRGAIPASFDWRDYGVVTSIKDQGTCGGCYAFSAAGAIESAWAIKGYSLASLSPQQIIDCSTGHGNNGCDGGFIDYSLSYVISNGINSASTYPFANAKGACNFRSSSVAATISSYYDIIEGSETGLTQAIYNYGPVSVGIDASRSSFQLYKGGIYYDETCSSSGVNHAVLAVGYGQDSSGNLYYIVKNTWGTSWGESGYIKMARNRNNNCGIATMASFPVV